MTSSDQSSKEPPATRTSSLRFLREQDGNAERLLKSTLVESFKQLVDVQRAYLAQVSAGDNSGVTLCLRTRHGPDPNVVREIGAIFAALFVRQEHLDILFLNDSQESALRSVCAPFYAITAPNHWLIFQESLAMSISFQGKALVVNGHLIELPWPILDAIEHADKVFVLFDPDSYLVDPSYKVRTL